MDIQIRIPPLFTEKSVPGPSNFIVYISLPAARCGSDGTAVVSPSRKATSSASSRLGLYICQGLRRAVYHDHLDGLYGRVDAVHIEACRFRSGAALSTKCLQGRCLGCHQGHSAFAPAAQQDHSLQLMSLGFQLIHSIDPNRDQQLPALRSLRTGSSPPPDIWGFIARRICPWRTLPPGPACIAVTSPALLPADMASLRPATCGS